MLGMERFTWIKSSETMAVATIERDGTSLSVTVAASIPEGEQCADFFVVGIVGVIDEEEIITSGRSWPMPGTRSDGSPSKAACFYSCGDLLAGPSMSAAANIVHVFIDRRIDK